MICCFRYKLMDICCPGYNQMQQSDQRVDEAIRHLCHGAVRRAATSLAQSRSRRPYHDLHVEGVYAHSS